VSAESARQRWANTLSGAPRDRLSEQEIAELHRPDRDRVVLTGNGAATTTHGLRLFIPALRPCRGAQFQTICRTVSNDRKYRATDLGGVYMAAATRSRISAQYSLLRYWHCFVCCPASAKAGGSITVGLELDIPASIR